MRQEYWHEIFTTIFMWKRISFNTLVSKMAKKSHGLMLARMTDAGNDPLALAVDMLEDEELEGFILGF